MSPRLIPEGVLAVLTVWMEARGEPPEGRAAVAEVIRNRTEQRFQSDGTLVGTLFHPYAFSCWNTKDAQRVVALKLLEDSPLIAECREAWGTALGGSNYGLGAVSYFNPAVVVPDWAETMVMTAEIGRHRFYKSFMAVIDEGSRRA